MANLVGSDLQNFNPTTNGLDFVTVHSSRTLEAFEFNVGTSLQFVSNSLPYSSFSSFPSNQSLSRSNDQILYSNVIVGLGLMPGWEIGLRGGFVNSQTYNTDNFLFKYGDMGINEYSFTTKVRLFKDEKYGFAFIGGVDFEQIQNNPFMGNDAGPTFNFEWAWDMQLNSNWLWAINLGYRLRQEGQAIPFTGVEPIGDQITYSTALSYQTTSQGSAWIGEIYGGTPIDATYFPSDRQSNAMEWLLGYRHTTSQRLDFHGGVGGAFFKGLGSPDYRLYLSLNYQLQSQ